ncbi:hypothetical protein A3H85_00865 [Candidatus Daviesbacteria bacterium RIFCSPLOWO2_02_FULL_40_8]|uniref:Methionine--tRNA ligase n=1 Tax=Candidatus Daviesbacteria bacterium RIFCSPLOWO2_01_FULL_40_24 TaxID=1797787 RepID=A0A1F5MIQ0_9BACT|nr:MAG: hypothetical protein A2780_02960 [Candidatus Daviesbacteria bacterium RIFCSPHIGHO2_01_FULL_41_45]OGE34089.1 MAG: hypothetical protein A3C32_00140 [Candidatus Daviesbacteria bacterium RIFCSPHIGHO2_02_FULL_41_14]OGE65244.1 MAG: hypothetical protein A3B49_02335 [Candidatus Daviesbacteria bacterium RIFCSPLOWO2_01_FULL_40_24]OGE66790.1 MAG: hypothetical protein A3H85_00865 [Candidatus Daviesbacteria bacterium RIFCSPLOWO2_02_FULL_40_8]
MISYDDFAKCEFRVGTVVLAEEIVGSDKLLKLQVDFKEEQLRQILSGIKQWYKPSQLIGKQFVFITNLEPRVMMGLESKGMILCADLSTDLGQAKPIPLKPTSKVLPGTRIR